MSTYRHKNYLVSTQKSKLDLEVVYNFLKKSYWAKGIDFAVFEKSVQNAYCFGLYVHDEQIGFARVITDFSRFAYLADVFILRKYRGKGLGQWLLYCIFNDKKLIDVNGWLLATQDAHPLYKKFGFHKLYYPNKFMQRKTFLKP
jgi:GNAT superfamily N-acetyltransferase